MTSAAIMHDDERAQAQPVSRLPERWVAGIGLGLAALFQGGFALVVTQSADPASLAGRFLPALQGEAEAGTIMSTLAAWYSLSLIIMALLCTVGFFLAARRPVRRSTGWWFLAAGLVCLFGTQLMLFPIAFFFFVAAGLFAVRSPHSRRTS